MYGSPKDVRYNLRLFFIDGMAYMPSLTLISVATVIPFFLERLSASTFQIGLAAALAGICALITQPLFGSLASRAKNTSRAFGQILLLQRLVFLAFIICIPFLSYNYALLIRMFLIFWGLFNLFVGSYGVFFPMILLTLIPPEKRGAIRGFGSAAGSVLSMGATALIPVVLYNISFPYNFTLIFLVGIIFLLIDAIVFLLMRDHGHLEPYKAMSVLNYIKSMPATIRDNPKFRAIILTCTLMIAANSLLPYYTLNAIRNYNATESHLAILAVLAVISNAVGYAYFGLVVDRRGPIMAFAIAAGLILSAGILALVTDSLYLLFVAWVLASMGSTAYFLSTSLLVGEVGAADKLPLYAGVINIISMAFSSAIVLLLAPVLENVGFSVLFVTVAICGGFSLIINISILKKPIKDN